jgi:hypothetical protein
MSSKDRLGLMKKLQSKITLKSSKKGTSGKSKGKRDSADDDTHDAHDNPTTSDNQAGDSGEKK